MQVNITWAGKRQHKIGAQALKEFDGCGFFCKIPREAEGGVSGIFFHQGNSRKMELKTGRVEALSDGIFAIAMTILIFGFEILISPQKGISEDGLIVALRDLWPDFLHYVIGFIILGAFWMEHHYQFNFIQRTDHALLLMNIIGLMFIALIPFSTCVAGDYGHTRAAAWILEINLAIAGLVFYLHWAYATAGCRLVARDLDRRTISLHSRRNLIVPLVSVAAFAVSAFRPRAGTMLYFIVPFVTGFYKATANLHRPSAGSKT